MDGTDLIPSRCRACGEMKPPNEFDIRADTGRRTTMCRPCRRVSQNDRNRRLHGRPRLARIAGATDLLPCTRCGALKSTDAFPIRNSRTAKLHSWCRACFADVKARLYARNRSTEIERARKGRDQRKADVLAHLTDVLATRSCVDCGERDPQLVRLVGEFTKPMTVTALARSGRCWSTLETQVAGWVVRCRGCLRGRGSGPSSRPPRPRVRVTPWPPLNSPTSERRCTTCGVLKPLDDFAPKYRELRRPSSRCRDCLSQYHRQWYERNRERVIARVRSNRAKPHESLPKVIAHIDARRKRWEYLLAHPCIDCGESNPLVLEFDHKREKKAAIVDLMQRHARWSEILVEIEKCDVRCANCHRRRTALARGYYRELAMGIAE